MEGWNHDRLVGGHLTTDYPGARRTTRKAGIGQKCVHNGITRGTERYHSMVRVRRLAVCDSCCFEQNIHRRRIAPPAITSQAPGKGWKCLPAGYASRSGSNIHNRSVLASLHERSSPDASSTARSSSSGQANVPSCFTCRLRKRRFTQSLTLWSNMLPLSFSASSRASWRRKPLRMRRAK